MLAEYEGWPSGTNGERGCALLTANPASLGGFSARSGVLGRPSAHFCGEEQCEIDFRRQSRLAAESSALARARVRAGRGPALLCDALAPQVALLRSESRWTPRLRDELRGGTKRLG